MRNARDGFGGGNVADEERVAARIQRSWDKTVARTLEEEGVQTARGAGVSLGPAPDRTSPRSR